MHPIATAQAMLRRIKAGISNVFQGQFTLMIAASQPLDFSSAERALAMVQ